MSDEKQIVEAVTGFFHRYNDAFNREDYAGFLDSFHYPNTWVHPRFGVMVNGTREELERGHAFVMSQFKERGWAHTRADAVQVWVMAPTLALMIVDKTRTKKDGSVLDKARHCYTVRDDGSGWRIVVAVEMEAPFVGPPNPSP